MPTTGASAKQTSTGMDSNNNDNAADDDGDIDDDHDNDVDNDIDDDVDDDVDDDNGNSRHHEVQNSLIHGACGAVCT